MPTLLILGAGSAIARACAREFAAHGWALLLAGRDSAAMERLAQETRAAGGSARALAFDALALSTHAAFWDALPLCPDAVLCAVGLLGDQAAAWQNPALADLILRTNFNGPASILGLAAEAFARRGHGLIIGISSVAGVRVRAANYPYGSAKAGFSAWLAGLRAQLAPDGVRVLTVLPGLTSTPMLEGRRLPAWLIAPPERVARDIFHAALGQQRVLYTPWFWRPLMYAARLLPERLFQACRR